MLLTSDADGSADMTPDGSAATPPPPPPPAWSGAQIRGTS